MEDRIKEAYNGLLQLEESIARYPSGLEKTAQAFQSAVVLGTIVVEEETTEEKTEAEIVNILKSILSKAKEVIDLNWQEEDEYEECYKGIIVGITISLLGQANPAIRMSAAKVVADVVETHRMTTPLTPFITIYKVERVE